MKTIKSKFLAMLALSALFVSQSCTDHGDPDPKTNISIHKDNTLGNILVDGKGNSLYFLEKDVTGTSNCSGGCATVWPIFYEEYLATGSGVEASLFATITREDGNKQTTYKGCPLYRFAQDTNPGDLKGDNKNGFFAAKPDYTVFFANKGDGRYLVDAVGKTLYTFANDVDDVSNCKDGCTAVWPSFFFDPQVVPSPLALSNFGKLPRADGKQQTTFIKKALYFFASDAGRGDKKGTAANAKFVVVSFQ